MNSLQNFASRSLYCISLGLFSILTPALSSAMPGNSNGGPNNLPRTSIPGLPSFRYDMSSDYDDGHPPEPFSYVHCETLLNSDVDAEKIAKLGGQLGAGTIFGYPVTDIYLTEKAWSVFNMKARSRTSPYWHVEIPRNGVFQIVRSGGSIAYERSFNPNAVCTRKLVKGPYWSSTCPYAVLEELADGVRVVLDLNNQDFRGELTLSLDVPRDLVSSYIEDNFFVQTQAFPKILSGDKEYYRLRVIVIQPDNHREEPWWKDRKPYEAPSGHYIIKPIVL